MALLRRFKGTIFSSALQATNPYSSHVVVTKCYSSKNFFFTLHSDVQNKCNILFFITDRVIPRSATSLGNNDDSKDINYHLLSPSRFGSVARQYI